MPDLYLAPPRTILRAIQNLDEASEVAFLFGHNPGMHETVNLLCEGPGLEDFPTLAVARIEIPKDHWGEAEWGGGILMEYLTPRSVGMD